MRNARVICTFALISAAAAGLGVQLTVEAEALSDGDCTVAWLQGKSPRGTTITAATMIEATGNEPKFCRVDGSVVTENNSVNFRVALPASWNGKFFYGSANIGLAKGYATASSNAGDMEQHAQKMSPEQEWAKAVDFGHRGTHVTAVVAKDLTAAYYSRPSAHSYYSGCSAGGRVGLIEAQWYPSDFDGIIVGGPGFGTTLQIFRALLYQRMLAKEENYLPPDKVELLSRATLAECDAKDGLKDGLISDPRLCRFQPESLKCSGADGPECLTAAQIRTVQQIYAPVKTAAGQVIVPGFPIGHEGGKTGWQGSLTGAVPPTVQPDGTLKFMATKTMNSDVPNGFIYGEQYFRYLVIRNFDWKNFDLDRDLGKTKKMAEIQDPTDPDLRPFKRQKGKLLLYHGWSDPMLTAYWTLGYYDNVVKAVGGQRHADEFVRLFLAPGMHHCQGGPGPNSFDQLGALENWVERDTAPDHLTISHSTDGRVDRTRPLCPYPKVARYMGSGSIDEGANFTCEAPRIR